MGNGEGFFFADLNCRQVIEVEFECVFVLWRKIEAYHKTKRYYFNAFGVIAEIQFK